MSIPNKCPHCGAEIAIKLGSISRFACGVVLWAVDNENLRTAHCRERSTRIKLEKELEDLKIQLSAAIQRAEKAEQKVLC